MHFYNSVTRLGYALQGLVGKEQLCRLGQSRSLEAWVEALPLELQAPTRNILGISRQQPSLEDASAYHRFGLALAAIGDREAAITEVQEAIRFQPGQAWFYHTLGYTYYDLECLDEAISAWKIAAYLDEMDTNAACNIASALVSKGEGVAAVAWFCEATRRQPKRAALHFYLGKALAEIKDRAEARAAWEQALMLDDERFAKAAQEALEENPLPNTADKR